jgi:hypothetical protein
MNTLRCNLIEENKRNHENPNKAARISEAMGTPIKPQYIKHKNPLF